MWPFTTKYTLESSNLLNGFTDWHSHLLPGVDDGVQKLEETLAILKEYERLGVTRVWLTPHVMEDFPNTVDELKEKFNSLVEAYKGPIQLKLAAENMLDNLFDERIAKGEVLPIGDANDKLLVETSYYEPPTGFNSKIESIFSKGLYPLLAHPERYAYMDNEQYDRLLARGVKMQLNLYSFFGLYGEEAASKARYLLKKGAYCCVGTDTHKMRHINFANSNKALTKKDIELISQLVSFS